ncbi:MAG TPA: hypothetical protein VMA96_03560 [Solirubrobacteraceae bacterium]|nr:hypothetical protein [Solirubrobacteraceae bacterium]
MATESSDPSYTSLSHAFRGFDRSVERVLGVDVRLLYGMVVPILMISGLIVLLALSPQTWLQIAVLLLELAALGVVLTGFIGILNDNGEEDTEDPGARP